MPKDCLKRRECLVEAVTKADVIKWIAILRINFANALPTKGDDEEDILVLSWYALLRVYPRELIAKALERAIANSGGYAPTIGHIIKEAKEIQLAMQPTASALWDKLVLSLGTVRINIYRLSISSMSALAYERIKQAYDDLDPLLKEHITSVRELKELADADDETLVFERRAFLKAAPSLQVRLEVKAMIATSPVGKIEEKCF